MEAPPPFTYSTGCAQFRLTVVKDCLQVLRSIPTFDGTSVSILRWLFPIAAREEAATRLRDEVVDWLGTRCQELRRKAVSAVARAVMAEDRMRRGSAALRQLVRQGGDATDEYLREGRRMVDQCIEVERLLNESGYRPTDRAIPEWIDQVLQHAAEVHQQDSSSFDQAEAMKTGTGG